MRASLLLVCLLAACTHAPPKEERPTLRAIAPADRDAIAELRRINDTVADQSARLEAEWKLVQALEHAGLLNLAFIYVTAILRAPGHPHFLEAVEAQLRLQALRRDELLAPSILNNKLAHGAPAGLSPQGTARLAYVRARIAFRKGELKNCLSLTSEVPPSSPVFARTQYQRAIALADPRLEGGARTDEAITTLEALAALEDPAQEERERVRDQTLLALGRLHYGARRWSDASRWYELAAKRPAVKARAMFEESFVRFQQRAWAAGLALLQSREVRDSGIAEAATAEAMALHFAGDQAGAERAIAAAQLHREGDTVDWTTAEAPRAEDACRTGRWLAPQTLALLQENHRIALVLANLEAFENERLAVTSAWQGEPATTFEMYLTQNLGSLKLALGSMCLTELRNLERESGVATDVADLIGIEVALSARDLDRAIERAERMMNHMPEKSVPRADLLFRLVALRQARAEVMTGPDAAAERTQIAKDLEEILAGDPSFERMEEARHFLDAPSTRP